jgi:predicted RNase H-like HicB family nuclease
MRKYVVIFEKTKTGYSAYVPDLPGCIGTGKTKAMTEKNIYEAIQFHLEGLQEEGLPIPKPLSEAENFVFAI